MNKEILRQEKIKQDKLTQDNDNYNKKWSAEVGRRRPELHESNETSRYEKVEAKQKDEAAKAVRKQINDELKIESIAKVDIKKELETSSLLSKFLVHILEELKEKKLQLIFSDI